jgi:hypothetical protein
MCHHCFQKMEATQEHHESARRIYMLNSSGARLHLEAEHLTVQVAAEPPAEQLGATKQPMPTTTA